MPTPSPAWLRALSQQVEYVQPMKLSKGALSQLAAQRKMASDAASKAMELGEDKLVSGNHMIYAALKRAGLAPKFEDDAVRLLNFTKDDGKSVGALSLDIPGTKIELPDNALFIDSFGSVEPGVGRALLEDIKGRYPDSPVFLQSLPLDDTLQFYTNRGFYAPAEDPFGSRSMPTLYIERASQLKKTGGVVR